MATVSSQKTFKHRNIIDDILDLGLFLVAIGLVLFNIEIELDKSDLLQIGAGGAAARMSVRRILMHFWGEKLGLEADDEPKEVEQETLPSETPTHPPEEILSDEEE